MRTLAPENNIEPAMIIIAKNELGHTGDISIKFNIKTLFFLNN